MLNAAWTSIFTVVNDSTVKELFPDNIFQLPSASDTKGTQLKLYHNYTCNFDPKP